MSKRSHKQLAKFPLAVQGSPNCSSAMSNVSDEAPSEKGAVPNAHHASGSKGFYGGCGAEHGGESPRTFPVAADLLASNQSQDRGRRVEAGLGTAAAQASSSWPHPVGGSDGRRHVFLGEKRGSCVGKTNRGKGSKILVLVDGRGLPLGAELASTSPHEVTLIEPLLERRIQPTKSCRLIYDQAADSDPLRARLAKREIELVCPHRENRKKPPTQDGRRLRRYRRRWKFERSIGWLQNVRRLVTRYEYYAHLFHGFVQLACLIVVMRRFRNCFQLSESNRQQ